MIIYDILRLSMIFYDYSDKYSFSFFNFAEFSALNLRHLEIIMATRKANVPQEGQSPMFPIIIIQTWEKINEISI